MEERTPTSLEAASAVASSIIAPKLDELREAVAKRGEDVKLALASARLQASSLTADAEARKSRLRGVVDDIKRLEERLARDRDRADAARLAAGRDEDALAAEADAARLASDAGPGRLRRARGASMDPRNACR